jgi:hemin uptake protein HemP
MDYIANPQRTALDLGGRDGEVAVIVSHDADIYSLLVGRCGRS